MASETNPVRSLIRMMVLALSATAPGITQSAQAEMTCPKIEGMIPGPYVPSADAAIKIYKAVAEAKFPGLFEKYPTLAVDDLGQRWSVPGMRMVKKDPQPTEQNPSKQEIVVTAGGGQLSMEIDKCNGAITNAHLNR